MTKYKCGHKSNAIILDNNALSFSAYLTWKDSVGWNGSKEKCWACWCETAKIQVSEVNEKAKG